MKTKKTEQKILKKEEMKSQTKNDKDIRKEERNKILLKLLVNKELSRITSISKELRKQTKPNKKDTRSWRADAYAIIPLVPILLQILFK